MILHDMNSRLNQTAFELSSTKKYSSRMFRSIRQKDECLMIEKVSIQFDKPDLSKATQASLLDDNTSIGNSLSTEGEDHLQVSKSKYVDRGFKPKHTYKWNAGEETFNLEINDQVFEKTQSSFKKSLVTMSIQEACLIKDKVIGMVK